MAEYQASCKQRMSTDRKRKAGNFRLKLHLLDDKYPISRQRKVGKGSNLLNPKNPLFVVFLLQ